jgi:hypothetical protein
MAFPSPHGESIELNAADIPQLLIYTEKFPSPLGEFIELNRAFE